MKLLLFIIGLALCASSPSFRNLAESSLNTQSGEVTSSDLLSQVRADSEANNALDFGTSTVINQGIKDTKIPNDSFTVSAVSDYSKTSDNNGNIYKFSCTVANADGSSVINMNFTVYYQLSNQKRTLSSYSYNVKPTTGNTNTPVADYVQVDDAEINTDLVQTVLKYGGSQIYAIGSQAGKIPVSDFTITNVVSVWKQVTTPGTNYRCQVVLENNNNVTINANFTVLYNTATQQTSLSQYEYTVKNASPNTNTNTNSNTNTNTKNNTNTNTNSNTNTTSAYAALSQSEIANSAEVQGALNYGANQTLSYGYTKGRIPVSTYSITKVVSVGKQAISNGRNSYQCDIELQDAKKVLVKAQFVVNVKVSTQEMSISKWSYQVLNNGNSKSTKKL